MSNINAINRAPGGIDRAAAATTLIGQKPNPWFNVHLYRHSPGRRPVRGPRHPSISIHITWDCAADRRTRKTLLTEAQGASAEIVAMATIGAAAQIARLDCAHRRPILAAAQLSVGRRAVLETPRRGDPAPPRSP